MFYKRHVSTDLKIQQIKLHVSPLKSKLKSIEISTIKKEKLRST